MSKNNFQILFFTYENIRWAKVELIISLSKIWIEFVGRNKILFIFRKLNLSNLFNFSWSSILT